jgi:hypothetical protein
VTPTRRDRSRSKPKLIKPNTSFFSHNSHMQSLDTSDSSPQSSPQSCSPLSSPQNSPVLTAQGTQVQVQQQMPPLVPATSQDAPPLFSPLNDQILPCWDWPAPPSSFSSSGVVMGSQGFSSLPTYVVGLEGPGYGSGVDLMDLYHTHSQFHSIHQSQPIPELLYCFDPSSGSPESYSPMSVDSQSNSANMTLLGLDMPDFCPLPLNAL